MNKIIPTIFIIAFLATFATAVDLPEPERKGILVYQQQQKQGNYVCQEVKNKMGFISQEEKDSFGKGYTLIGKDPITMDAMVESPPRPRRSECIGEAMLAINCALNYKYHNHEPVPSAEDCCKLFFEYKENCNVTLSSGFFHGLCPTPSAEL